MRLGKLGKGAWVGLGARKKSERARTRGSVGIGVVAARGNQDVRRLVNVRRTKATAIALVVARTRCGIGQRRRDLSFDEAADQSLLVGLPAALLIGDGLRT